MFQKEMSYFGKTFLTSNLDSYEQTQLNPKLKPYRGIRKKCLKNESSALIYYQIYIKMGRKL